MVIELGTSATKAKNKYAGNNYDQVRLLVKKGEKEQLQKIAELSGQSLNAWINEAIAEKRLQS